jgi:hypothetical protein
MSEIFSDPSKYINNTDKTDHDFLIGNYINRYIKLTENPHSLTTEPKIPILDENEQKELNSIKNLENQTEYIQIENIKNAQQQINIVVNGVMDSKTTEKDISLAIKSLSVWAKNSTENQILLISNLLGSTINLSALVLISEIYQNEDHSYFAMEIDEILIKYLDKNILSKTMRNQLTNLNRTNDIDDNMTLHKIVDFMKYHSQNIQRLLPAIIQKFPVDHFINDFDIHIGEEIVFSANYLVQKNFYDYLESRLMFNQDGSLGAPGGNLDENIFKSSKRCESYNNRVRLGINEGLLVPNPVLPISPDFLGYYQKGKVVKVFDTNTINDEKNMQRLTDYVSKNDSKYNYIYDEINASENYTSKNYGSKTLKIYYYFSKELKADNCDFFFDISKIQFNQLNPTVRDVIFNHNQTYLDKIEGKRNITQEIPQEQFEKLLFPYNKKGSNKELILYKQLSSLHMRKKIEDDFGINIANFDFATQRNFLEFLETKTTQDAKSLMEFTKKFGDNAFKSFLSLEHGQEMGEKILTIGEKLPVEEANKIFAKYAEIIATTEKIKDYLIENFGKDKDYSEETVQSITEKLLGKGKDLLCDFADNPKDPMQIVEDLEKYQTDLLLFAGTFKTLKKQGAKVELEDFKNVKTEVLSGAELPDETRKVMFKIADENWKQYPMLHDIVMKGLSKALNAGDNKFYVVNYGKDTVGFIRFDPVGEFELYAGSLNIRTALRGSSIGEALLQNILAKEAQEKNLEATAYPRLPIAPRYIGEFGFTVDGVIPNYENTRQPFLHMVRDD